MIEKLDTEQLIGLERATNSSLAPIYRAMQNDDYNTLRVELSKPSFDINQVATSSENIITKKAATIQLKLLIDAGNLTLGEDRNVKDKIAHFCLACTVLGLVPMVYNKIYNGSFFLNSTKRQTLLSDIENDQSMVGLIAGG
jgi:hypothetical protein